MFKITFITKEKPLPLKNPKKLDPQTVYESAGGSICIKGDKECFSLSGIEGATVAYLLNPAPIGRILGKLVGITVEKFEKE